MKTMNTTASVILSMVIVLLVGEAQSQNYHFSNGWQPGKRSQDMCQFRSDVKNVIFKLIEDEISRMMSEPSCYGGVPAFKHFLKKDLSYALERK